MTRKKYSVNVEDGKLISVEVDGKEYRDPEDIPDADDRDMVQMLIMGGPEPAAGREPETTSAADPTRIVLWVFVGVAVLMGIITAVAVASSARSMAREASAPGRVVELLAVNGSDGGVFYAPLVDFAGPDGERYLAQAGGASRPPAYKVGQPVEVRYDPADPQSARLTSFWGNVGQYTVALITGVLMIAFCGAALLAAWIGKPVTPA